MNNIPSKLRDELTNDEFYKKCARNDMQCKGRITWEHALYYKGKQVQEWWSIVPLCWYHHLGCGMVKKFNEWVALSRLFNSPKALIDARNNYPKVFFSFGLDNWENKLKFLNKLYGKYNKSRKGQGTTYKKYQ
jgi:hypothetical protein